MFLEENESCDLLLVDFFSNQRHCGSVSVFSGEGVTIACDSQMPMLLLWKVFRRSRHFANLLSRRLRVRGVSRPGLLGALPSDATLATAFSGEGCRLSPFPQPAICSNGRHQRCLTGTYVHDHSRRVRVLVRK